MRHSFVHEPHAVDGPSSDDAFVAGGVVAAFRSIMVARDQWDYVRQALCAEEGLDESWLDHVAPHDWVALGGYVRLLEAICLTLGVEELRSLVRRRLMDPAGSNFFAPMLRAWARSFGSSPEHMLRGTAQLWRTAHRNAGSVRATAVSDDEVHLVMEGRAADVYRASPAFAAFFEGMALGFLDLAQPRPVFVEVELMPKREPLVLMCRFGELTSRRLPLLEPAVPR
jgi:hypothetical protein